MPAQNIVLREHLVRYAERYISTHYSWGGDDPSGFDCSGIVVEVLQAFGVIGRKEDLTAAGLYLRSTPSKMYQIGDLAFFKDKNGKVYHVEMLAYVIGTKFFTIGASGGTSKTITKEDAIRDNAFIKVRPLEERGPYEIRSII